MRPALVVLGVLCVAGGLFLLWTGTYGVAWNSTHNRLLHRANQVSVRQETTNTVLARIAGPVVIAVGITLVVMGA